jgi:peptidoglycan/LPS O-acetylase OafA/YrhL
VGAYAVRRAARLVPAYWLILALVLLLLAIVDLGGPTSFPGTGNIAVHAFYLQTPVSFVRDLHMGFGVDGPVWTLSLEVTFYILLPLVAGWYFRRPLLGLAIAALITALWHEAIGHYDDLVSWLGANPSPSTSLRLQLNGLIQFPFFAFSFAAGMTGAWAYVRFRETATARHVRIAQLASLASLALFAFLVGHNATRGGVLFGAEFGRLSPIVAIGFSGSLAAVMVTTSLTGARSQRVFANPLARRLGDISYGIYLAHVVIIVYVLRLDVIPMEHRPNTGTILGGNGDLGSFLLLAAIVIPGAVLYGYLSARFVEQPIRRWAHRFGRRGQELAAAYTS